jgi:isopenicillin N synthase-like dioxygenase
VTIPVVDIGPALPGAPADPVYAPNRWPARPEGFRGTVEAYYRAMSDLSAAVMRGFAVALDLDEAWFDPMIDRHGSALRLAHYPALRPGSKPILSRCGSGTSSSS